MKIARLSGLGALFCAALVFPLLFSNSALTTVAFFTLVYATAAIAWNIFSGYTGYISFGQASFWGFGAYTFALLCKNWHLQGNYSTFLLLLPSGLVAGLAALPLGWIALRTRQHIFVVVTIAILFILQLLVSNLPFLANGQDGLYTPVPNWSNDFFNYPFYYVALVLLLLASGVSWWIRHSKFGLGLLAVRDDEERALGLGVKTKAYKLGAYCLSAVFLGMAGALFFYFLGSIVQPAGAFDPSLDITLALMVFLGGIGTVTGPLLGALIMVPIEQYLDIQIDSPGLELMLYGSMFLVILFFLPNGILPSLRAFWYRYQISRKEQRAEKGLLAPAKKMLLEDINSVASSMHDTEKATVAGSRLADEADQALNSIFSVVEQQANEIMTISRVVTQHLESSGDVVQIMQAVSDLTRQGNLVTRETAQEMGEIAQLAEELHMSVQVFKIRTERVPQLAGVSRQRGAARQPSGPISLSGPAKMPLRREAPRVPSQPLHRNTLLPTEEAALQFQTPPPFTPVPETPTQPHPCRDYRSHAQDY